MQMKWFGKKYQKLSEEVSSLRREVGKRETVSIWDSLMCGHPLWPHTRTVLERLAALEEKNRMLCEYLKIEKREVASVKFYRKKAGIGK
jgi:hypothetical protein